MPSPLGLLGNFEKGLSWENLTNIFDQMNKNKINNNNKNKQTKLGVNPNLILLATSPSSVFTTCCQMHESLQTLQPSVVWSYCRK